MNDIVFFGRERAGEQAWVLVLVQGAIWHNYKKNQLQLQRWRVPAFWPRV